LAPVWDQTTETLLAYSGKSMFTSSFAAGQWLNVVPGIKKVVFLFGYLIAGMIVVDNVSIVCRTPSKSPLRI